MATILAVDDELDLLETIANVLRRGGHAVATAATGAEAIAVFGQHGADVAVVDLVLTDTTGIVLLDHLRRTDRHLPVIILTGQASVPTAVEAMRAGAFDYLMKPFDNDDLRTRVAKAVEHRRLHSRLQELETDVEARLSFPEVVGRSAAIQGILRQMTKVARTDVPILLTGESGTGKDLIARSIHQQGPRAGGPFVAVNCGAIPASLAEAEMFGHVAGAFTDAKSGRRGFFERAHAGTLLLDEVADLPLDLQVKLLRVLEDHRVVRVGGEEPVATNTRLIAATNKDLDAEVTSGRFRDDLRWRLGVIHIHVPPLRDRMDDLIALIGRLLPQVNAETRTAITRLSAQVLERFYAYPWPGNVRELLNVLRQAAVMSEGDEIQLVDLPTRLQTQPSCGPGLDGTTQNAPLSAEAAERQLLEATLARFSGNRTAAARALGVTRRTISRRLRRGKVDTP